MNYSKSVKIVDGKNYGWRCLKEWICIFSRDILKDWNVEIEMHMWKCLFRCVTKFNLFM